VICTALRYAAVFALASSGHLMLAFLVYVATTVGQIHLSRAVRRHYGIAV
jgi:hypothetical protein